MKFLFVAPRFHTNQSPIIKRLIEEGHTVEFFVQRFGKSEDHSIRKPYLMKKSILSTLLYRIIDFKYNVNIAENMKAKFFIPAKIKLFKQVRKYRPDVVILRDLNFSSICVYFVCRLLKIESTIFYNQAPLYSSSNRESDRIIKNTIKKIGIKYLLPKVRITPVYTNNISGFTDNERSSYTSEHDYFVPFIAETNEEAANRRYCFNQKINILDVGKYRDYKNHFLLVDAITLIKDRSNLKVTIVGQVVNEEEQKYYDSLKAYIRKKNLNEIVNLEKNVEYIKMNQIYQRNDIFVLTSKVEVASISVLEAMANGMITISTDANGTASYIIADECGYLFKTMDEEDLAIKIEQVISDKANIHKMGRNAYLNIKNNYSFHNYYSALGEVLEKEFGICFINKQNYYFSKR